eukprot:jgi/Bigna1/85724/estExt_fgenesh1_pg.C_50344
MLLLLSSLLLAAQAVQFDPPKGRHQQHSLHASNHTAAHRAVTALSVNKRRAVQCHAGTQAYCVVDRGTDYEAIYFYAFKKLNRGTKDTRTFIVQANRVFYTESIKVDNAVHAAPKGDWALPVTSVEVDGDELTITVPAGSYTLTSKQPSKTTDSKCNQAAGTQDQLCPTAATIKDILQANIVAGALTQRQKNNRTGIEDLVTTWTKAIGHAPYYNPEHFITVNKKTRKAVALQRTRDTNWEVAEDVGITDAQVKNMFNNPGNILALDDANLWMIADDDSLRFGREHQPLHRNNWFKNRAIICHGDLNVDIHIGKWQSTNLRGHAKGGGEFKWRAVHKTDGTEADGRKWVIDNRTSFVGNRASSTPPDPAVEIERLRLSWMYMKNTLGFLGMENSVFIRDDINKYNTYGGDETAAACAQFQYQTHDGTNWVDVEGNPIA